MRVDFRCSLSSSSLSHLQPDNYCNSYIGLVGRYPGRILSHLHGELRELRQRFHRELRELNDEWLTLQQELDRLDDREELVALVEEWL